MVTHQRAEGAKHDSKHEARAAADDNWQKHRQHRFAGAGFMGLGEANTFDDQAPDSGNGAAAHWDNHERIGRSDRVAKNSQGGFVAAFRSADQRQG